MLWRSGKGEITAVEIVFYIRNLICVIARDFGHYLIVSMSPR
jgi:hypothetical protein